jgi:branched-chain amino acid transport system ATP-binding protein
MLLELKGVSVSFDGLQALESVDLTLREGMIKSLIGPNGAGKTTLFNIVSGLASPTYGRVIFQGRDITGKKPFQISRRGIARTFQNIRLFNNMTVLENVLVGQHTQLKSGILGSTFRPPRVVREEAEARKRAIELLSFFGSELVDRQEEYVINLSYAYRRRVEVARALASSPKLLLLDEPTAGMNEAETLDAVKYVRRLRMILLKPGGGFCLAAPGLQEIIHLPAENGIGQGLIESFLRDRLQDDPGVIGKLP